MHTGPIYASKCPLIVNRNARENLEVRIICLRSRIRTFITPVNNAPHLAEPSAYPTSGFLVRIVPVHGLFDYDADTAGFLQQHWHHVAVGRWADRVRGHLCRASESADLAYIRRLESRDQSRGEPESRGIMPRKRASVIMKSSCRFLRYRRAASSDSAATQCMFCRTSRHFDHLDSTGYLQAGDVLRLQPLGPPLNLKFHRCAFIETLDV